MLKRQAVENIERQKIEMIAAIYANGNYESDELSKAVEGLEKHYKSAVESVYSAPETKKRKDNEPDWDNPFWAGAKRSYDRQAAALAELQGAGVIPHGEVSVKTVMDRQERHKARFDHLDQHGKTRN